MSRTRAVVPALVLALVLAACGGDDATTDDGAAGDDAAEENGDDNGGDDGGDAGAAELPDNDAEGFTADTIRIGWMGDATGPTASAQGLNLSGIEAWTEYINEQGGILGREVELVTRDDEFNAERAVGNYRALVDDERVLAIIGVGGAHIMEALAPDIESVGIPVIGPPQTIEVQLQNPYIFSNIGHYGDQADVAIPRLAERAGVPVEELRVAVIQLELPSGDEWDTYIRASVEEQGGTYVGRVTMPTAATDYATVLTQVRQLAEAEDANAIAFHGAPANGLGVLNEMASQDFTDIPVVGIHGIAGSNIYTESPDDVQDVMEGVHSFSPCNLDTPGTQTIRDFVAGTEWEEDCKQINFSHGWLDGLIFQQAVERAAETGEVSRESLRDALQGTFDAQGLSCDIDWTDTNHNPCVAPFQWDEADEALVIVNDDFTAWEQYVDGEYGLLG